MNKNKNFEKNKYLYDSINNLYINKYRTLDECCNDLNISRSSYYYVCIKHNFPNICLIVKKKKMNKI